jgi:AraC-like DNA-binding protein
MATMAQLHKTLADFQKTLDCRALDLRLSFADIVIDGLDRNNWGLAELSGLSGVAERTLSRIINADQNCTFYTAARILYALGIEVEFVIKKSAP